MSITGTTPTEPGSAPPSAPALASEKETNLWAVAICVVSFFLAPIGFVLALSVASTRLRRNRTARWLLPLISGLWLCLYVISFFSATGSAEFTTTPVG